MVLYLPLEILFNGFVFVPFILIAVALLAITLYIIYKQWFQIARFYFFFSCILSILPMMYLVPTGAGNEFLFIPVSLLPVIFFKEKKLQFILFVFVVSLFFVVINTRQFITPLVQVPQETILFFRNIYIAMVFFLIFTIVSYFKKIASDLDEINFNKNELLKNSNKEITAQKNEIEIQHQEIKSSISYAKRIQTAILPSNDLIQKYLPNSFIIYKPKDIVAGDFYWMHVLPQPNGWEVEGDTILFSAADCTGHGVPGAMVSVVCNNALNQSVKEFGITQPNLILDKTRELIIDAFAESEEDVKDGMDLSLCALNLKTNILTYAGANNPLWIIRKNAKEIEEIKGCKQPIGSFEMSNPFMSHSVQLSKGDTIYIFTDGFVDQFGGPRGKKLKSKAFRKLLLSIQELSIDKQKNVIVETFENWKGNLEQVDDVCIIGVEI